MATVYVRRFDLKGSLTDSDVAAFWKYAVEEFLRQIESSPTRQNVYAVEAGSRP